MFQNFLYRLLVFFIVLSGLSSATLTAQVYSNNPVLMKIGQEELRLNDIQDQQIYELRQQLHSLIVKKMNQEGLAKLYEKYPDQAIFPNLEVDESQVRAIYQANFRNRGTYEGFAPKIRSYLQEQTKMMFEMQQLEQATQNGLVKVYLLKPDPFLPTVAIQDAYQRGNGEAKVVLLEFSDYQCPFCNRVQETVQTLFEKYQKDVMFAYRHFPLEFHKEADEAAMAAECARDQGKFQEYHQMLYQNQKAQFIPDLKKYARAVQVSDLKKFDACLTSQKYRNRVNDDIQAAVSAGFRGTPGFVIGLYDAETHTVQGETLSGAQPLHVFENLILKYLTQSQ